VAHWAGAYPNFCRMKQPGVFGWNATPLQGYPHYVRGYPFIHLSRKRHCESIKCLAQEHDTMYPVRAQTCTTLSGDECTNHKVTVPPKKLAISEKVITNVRIVTENLQVQCMIDK